jgi:hypothetical protein
MINKQIPRIVFLDGAGFVLYAVIARDMERMFISICSRTLAHIEPPFS